jgi:isocitrate/isopropylmalate dehydrogenase
MIGILRSLAVGGPGPVIAGSWDAAPLVSIVTLIILMRWAGIHLHARTLTYAVAAGLLTDLVTDAIRLPFLTTLALLTLVFALIALRRMPSR